MKVMRLLQSKPEKSGINRIISGILIAVVSFSMLSGCAASDKAYEAPELVEPVALSRIFRKPVYRDIKDVKSIEGVAVPKDYPQYYKENMSISQIKVKVGDYVKKGDIVALGENAFYSEQLESENDEIDSISGESSIQNSIDDTNIQIEKLRKEDYEETGDTENASRSATNISLYEEDKRYNQEVASYKLETANSTRDSLSEKVDASTLVASKSGYVTFVRDISESAYVSAYENVVVISDPDDLYIECRESSDKFIDKGGFDEMYTYIDGVRTDLKYMDYPQEALSLAQVTEKKLFARFGADRTLTMGDHYLIILKKVLAENVLTVETGMITREGLTSYVYVKKGEDVERRDIEVGFKNDYYTEVRYGLDEDTEISYPLDSFYPVNYKEVEVETATVSSAVSSKFILLKNSQVKSYGTEYPGKIESINVNVGDMVSAGDVLFTYSTENTSAKLGEISERINTLKKNHSDTIEMYEGMKSSDGSSSNISNGEAGGNPGDDYKDAEISEVKSDKVNGEMIKQTDNASESDSMPTDKSSDVPKQGSHTSEISVLTKGNVDNQISLENRSYESRLKAMLKTYDDMSRNNDGNGLVTVYAEKDGVVKNLNVDEVREGKVFKNKVYVMSVADTGYDEILVQMRKYKSDGELFVRSSSDEVQNGVFKSAEIGQQVELSIDNKKYEGTAIGVNGSIKTDYLTEEDGKPIFTFCTPGTEYKDQFYVSFENGPGAKTINEKNRDLDIHFKKFIYRGVPVVDKGVVYKEYINEKQENYYVWKVTDNELEKQYVVLDQTENDEGLLVILDGLEIGDKVVREVSETAEDK